MCLSDGFPLGKDFPYPLRAVVDGDTKSAAIAAASIVAKVTRDRFMHRADALHPGWEFASHVGYSTPEHREAIQRLGVSPLHRMSFQSLAYQQLALVAPRRSRRSPRAAPSERVLEVLERRQPAGGVERHADRVEPEVLAARAVVDLGDVGAPIRRTWRCLRSSSASHGLPRPRRVLTSAMTSVSASAATRSISP